MRPDHLYWVLAGVHAGAVQEQRGLRPGGVIRVIMVSRVIRVIKVIRVTWVM